MPKKFLFIFALCILLCFAGCAPEKPIPTSAPETTEQTTTGEYTPVSVAAISLPVVREAECADDGTEIFLSTYQNVELVLPNPEIAEQVTLDLLNRMDTATATAKDILTQAKTDYTPSASWQSYICRNIYSPTRIDSGVLSLFGQLTTYRGNAHAEGVYSSVSYDLSTGNVLQLHNILLPHFDMDVLKDAIKASLAQQEAENYLYTYYPQVVDGRFAEDVLDDENWYFSPTGLCFYFAPYEIAPYASGVIVAEVPYSKLAGILENAYFPNEISDQNGKFTVETFDVSKLDNYNSFWEISLEKGSRKILLHPDSTLYNVRLERGSQDGELIPEYTLFAAGALSPNDALIIEYDNDASLSNLWLCYTANGKTVKQPLS